MKGRTYRSILERPPPDARCDPEPHRGPGLDEGRHDHHSTGMDAGTIDSVSGVLAVAAAALSVVAATGLTMMCIAVGLRR